jgi:hypothetical protein
MSYPIDRVDYSVDVDAQMRDQLSVDPRLCNLQSLSGKWQKWPVLNQGDCLL